VLSFRRSDAGRADGSSPLGHTGILAQKRAVMLLNSVGDAAVMRHKNEYKQKQHYTDPKNDRKVDCGTIFSHWRFLQ
jgi:hypothetical protein